MKRLHIIAHTPSENTAILRDAIVAGASDKALKTVEIVTSSPLETKPEKLLMADAIILFTTENFGYMSGALKDLFDRSFYNILEKTQGLPYAICVRAGKDGTGTVRSVESITKGLNWRQIQPPLVLKGEYHPDFEHKAHEYGQIIAAGLEVGLW